MRFQRNSKRTGDENGSVLPAEGGAWNGQYPALCEFIVAVRWDNGDMRVPGSLTLFTDSCVWKACLSDKDSGMIAFVTADTPDGVLSAANRGLETNALDWRPQRDRQPGKRSR